MNLRKTIFYICLLFVVQNTCVYAEDVSENEKKHVVDTYFKNDTQSYKNTKYFKAIQNYSKIIKLAPDNARAYYARALAYCRVKKYNKAITDFTHAVNLNFKNYKVYFNRGLAYSNIKQYDKAIADFTHAVKLDSNSSRTYYFRGKAYYYCKQYDKAIIDFSRAIKLNPKADSYYHRGEAYNYIKQYNKAIADFSQYIKLNPSNDKGYHYRGLAYISTKQYNKAIIDLSHTIKLNPKRERVYHARGLAYFFTDQYNKAIQDFSMSHDIYAYIGLTEIYYKLKQYGKAIENYSKMLELMKSTKAQDISQYIDCYSAIMEICLITGKNDKFNHWLNQFEKNLKEDKLSRSNLIIKLYLIMLNKCVMNKPVVDIEKRLNILLKNKGEIDSNWSFELTDEWLKNPQNGLTTKQIKYIQDLTKKVKDVFEK